MLSSKRPLPFGLLSALSACASSGGEAGPGGLGTASVSSGKDAGDLSAPRSEDTEDDDPPPSASPNPGMAINPACKPGRYTGTYTCVTPYGGGPLYFDLIPDETQHKDQDCVEFCTDLTIKQGGDQLTGEFALIHFQGELQGGLDCDTGEFRASLANGVWGLGGDTGSGVTFAAGKFVVDLAGERASNKSSENISGKWHATGDGASQPCEGVFEVAFQQSP